MLETRQVSKYFGGLAAVSDMSFSIERGQIVSVIGPNGSGKTTLFNLITGVHQPTGGKIFAGGKEITHLKPFQIAQRGIARTFQHTTVYSQKTVLDNLIIGYRLRTRSGLMGVLFGTARAQKEERESVDNAREVAAFIGLEAKLEKVADILTQEEQKRLAIGLALATRPQLLLLDEPTGGVTDQEIGALMDLIGRIKDSGITLCLIEHKMRVVMSISDRVVVLNYGKKIAEGTPDEVSRNREVIEAYLGEGYHA